MKRILLTLAMACVLIPSARAQLVTIQGSDLISASRATINNNFLYLQGSVVAKTASYTATSSDGQVEFEVNCASPCNFTLPASAPANGWRVVVLNINATVTVVRNGLTINGATSNLTLNNGQWARIDSDGSNYTAAVSTASGYATVGNNGTGLTQRTTLNVIPGMGVSTSCVDNAGSSRTDCTFSSDFTTTAGVTDLQEGRNYVVISTTGNTSYSGSPANGCASTVLTNGMWSVLNADTASSTTATYNLCGLGVISIKKADQSTDPGSGALGAGGFPANANVPLQLFCNPTNCSGTKLWLMPAGFNNAPPALDKFEVANCNNATAASALSLPASNAPTATCRTGTNVQAGTLVFAASQSAQFQAEIPADWQTGINPYIRINYTQTGTTASQTIAYQIQIGCSSTTDDPSFATAQAFSTTTTGATANTPYTQTLQLNSTSMTSCSAGNVLNGKISTTAGSTGSSGLQYITLTWPRTGAVQAN